MIKLNPLGDRLVVEAIEQEDATASGILIPESAKEKPQQGKVLAAGPGRLDDTGKRIPMQVGVGDRDQRPPTAIGNWPNVKNLLSDPSTATIHICCVLSFIDRRSITIC